jgi:hypothetical protein
MERLALFDWQICRSCRAPFSIKTYKKFPNWMNNTVLLLEGAQGISMFTAYSNVRFNYTELYGYNELIASYRMNTSLADSIVN